jgi:medium-chain acyl-[acyl-carrier-protein] hydrolase
MSSPVAPQLLQLKTGFTGSNPWIDVIPGLRAGVKLRLFCLPYAGGGASMYRTWRPVFPSSIEICPVFLPGREKRIHEPHIRDCNLLLENLMKALVQFTDEPYALFGHSMGAFLVYELAVSLIAQGRKPPAWIFISARKAPYIHYDFLSKPIRELSDEELVKDLSSLNPSSVTEFASNPGLASLVLPTLRADFEICETYSRTRHPSIPVPMTALGGISDPSVTRADLQAWDQTVSGRFSLHMFPGEHFFIISAGRQVQQLIAQQLLEVV